MPINIKLKTAIIEKKPQLYQWQIAQMISRSPQWFSLLVQNRLKTSKEIEEQIAMILGKNWEELFNCGK